MSWLESITLLLEAGFKPTYEEYLSVDEKNIEQ